jgi:hypothetical protein
MRDHILQYFLIYYNQNHLNVRRNVAIFQKVECFSLEKISFLILAQRASFPAEDGIAELCRCGDITRSMYYVWSKEFLEAGKRRLAGDPKPDRRVGSGADHAIAS